MTKTPLLFCTLILVPASLASTATSQETTLRDGRTLIGASRTNGETITIETLSGPVRVQTSEIERVRTKDELRTELTSLATQRDFADTPQGQLELARAAHRFGLVDEMWQHLGLSHRLLQTGEAADTRAAQRLSAFMAGLEPVLLPHRWQGKPTRIWVREMLHRLNGKVLRVQMLAIEEVLVARQREDLDSELRLRARSALNPIQREVAVRALARRAGAKTPYSANERFVYRTALLDSRESVRQAAMEITSAQGKSAAAIAYLGQALGHPDSAIVRIRAAEAFGRLRNEAAVPMLVAAGPTAAKLRAPGGGGTVRANMAVIEQRSYVRDFEVEVAQGAAIANPVVDVISSGTVLDVGVHAVTVIRTDVTAAYRKALREITGSDPGADPIKWQQWLEQQRAARKEAKAKATGSAPTTRSAGKN